ncbi:MAG: hypothetical protein CM15mP125_1520 [Gammaproteobacteria bacterium]|nr:MAG: hypothetical protein CM15mP125_1520 [Gammaproteobacteria bacterium]
MGCPRQVGNARAGHLIQAGAGDVPQPQSMASGGAEGDYLGSEDCLYLDIYAPGQARQTCRLCCGFMAAVTLRGIKGTYDFSRFAAREQVVVVVIIIASVRLDGLSTRPEWR